MRNWKTLPERLFHFSFPPATYECSNLSVSLPVLGGTAVCYFSHSDRCVVIAHCGFNLHFPDAKDVEHLFMCLLVTLYPHG